MALQEAYKTRPLFVGQEVNNELEELKCKLGMNTEVTLPGLPRTFSRKHIRFELPLDRKSLKGKYLKRTKQYIRRDILTVFLDEQFVILMIIMIIVYSAHFKRIRISDMTPLDYLRSNTSIIGSCQMIYSKVFEKHMDSETRAIRENVNSHVKCIVNTFEKRFDGIFVSRNFCLHWVK